MNQSRLSKNEKLTLLVSSLSLFISFTTPIINYLWFESVDRVQILKAQALRASGTKDYFFDDDSDHTQVRHHIHLENAGKLPLERVRVAVKYHGRTPAEANRPAMKILPPARATMNVMEDSYVVIFEDPMAPGEKLDLELTMIADPKIEGGGSRDELLYAWISSEASPSIPVTWQSVGFGL